MLLNFQKTINSIIFAILLFFKCLLTLFSDCLKVFCQFITLVDERVLLTIKDKNCRVLLTGVDFLENLLIKKLNKGEKVLGTFFEIGSVTAVEALSYTGLDYIIIDSEHGPFDIESNMEFIRTAELKGLTPLVRIHEISRSAVLKNLDVGAKGLIIPCVETVDQVKSLVQWGKYPPIGLRGFFTARPTGFGFEEFAKDISTLFQTSNSQTLLIPQCETLGCFENIEEIASINGVDGIFIGPYDLSISMGIPGEFTNIRFLEAIDRIVKACRENNKICFMFTMNPKMANVYFDQGIDAVAVGMDVSIYIRSLKDIVDEIKNGEE